MRAYDAIIAGGGLVGAAVAYGLARQGGRVLVLDEGDLALRASRGNFGLVWVQGKGLARPEYARWTRLSADLWGGFAAELADLTGIDVAHSRKGGVIIALSEQELGDLRALHDGIRRDLGGEGYDVTILDRAGLAEMVPGPGPGVAGASHCPHDGHADPLLLLRALHAGIAAKGGTYRANRRVTRIDKAGEGFAVEAGGERYAGATVVVAAGLGSVPLAEMIGIRAPIVPLHGQLLVTERVEPLFDIPTNLVRQTGAGSLMVGYSQDDFGFDTGTRPDLTRDIAARALRAFPFLAGLRVVRTWAALRVMTPDGYPIYQQSETHPGAFVATCHSGVTLAAAHALRFAPWLADGAIPSEFDCFRCDRFDVQKAA